jgi:phosphoserine phosphatase RsbU/P
MPDSSEIPHTLTCSEVWGGNRKILRAVQLSGVTAWVASLPLNEGEGGGDLHYMSVCDHDLISRVALADVSGHGRVVSSMAETLQKLMRKNINIWDQSDFMRGLNDTFLRSGQEKYATAIVLSIHRITGALAFSNAGHLPPLWYHARRKTWGWLKEHGDPLARGSGLPIGLIPGTDYRQTFVTLEASDLLVLYTDGVTEAENDAGQSLDRKQLLKWAREAPIDSPEALGQALLKRLETYQGRYRNDDETLIVLQREKASVVASLGNVDVNHSVRSHDELEIGVQQMSQGRDHVES